MTIEVRQLLIRSLVDPQDGGGSDGGVQPTGSEGASTEWLDRLKEEVISECKAWLEDQLRRARER